MLKNYFIFKRFLCVHACSLLKKKVEEYLTADLLSSAWPAVPTYNLVRQMTNLSAEQFSQFQNKERTECSVNLLQVNICQSSSAFLGSAMQCNVQCVMENIPQQKLSLIPLFTT